MKIKIDFISIIEKWGRHLIPCSYSAPYTKISYNSPQLPGVTVCKLLFVDSLLGIFVGAAKCLL